MSVENINRLPHLAPVRFVKEVLLSEENRAISIVEFHEVPTLSAIVEAAAQNVVFIDSLHRIYNGGVLTAMKNVELLNELTKGSYVVESEISTRLDNFSMFTFTLSQNDKIFVKGEMSIVMKERDEKL